MKKIYFIAVIALAFTVNLQAQSFDDDIEGYPLGTIHTSPWLSWDGIAGNADDISVSDDQALSGSQSILIAEGGVIDGVMDLGNVSSGIWYLDFNMYIPSGKSGYFNMQGVIPAGTTWNFHVTFNEGGSTETEVLLYDATAANQGPGNVLGSGSYAPDSWFPVSFVFDVDNGTMNMSVFGSQIASGVPIGGTGELGGLNLYSNEGGGESNRYYVDNARFDNTALGVDDFSADVFSVYPNPVQDVLNIQSKTNVDSVVIYDVLGKVVLSARPDAISPKIDMSGLTSGAYMVNVTIDGASKTVKVIK